MDLGEKLLEEINPKTMFEIHAFGFKIPVSDTVVSMWIVMVIIAVIAVIITRRMKLVPTSGKQHLAELAVNFINKLAKDNIGHDWRHFAPYIGSVAVFLVFANIISVVSFIPDWKWLHEVTGLSFFANVPDFKLKPPTRDINTTAAMAIMSITVVAFGGIIIKGPVKWLKNFLQPNPIILPFKILDYFIRPTSLALRLFGNILGGFIIMELVYLIMPVVFPAALSIYFDLFDGLIQAYIFVFLTSFYIAESVE